MNNYRELLESLRMAVFTLGANKLRSFLTTLGIIIGVMTVIGMVSIIQGLNRSFTDQVESLGSNTIFISKFDPSFRRNRTEEERQRKELTFDDSMAIQNDADAILATSPEKRKAPVTIVYQNRSTDSPELQGVTTSYELTRTAYNSEGRFITETDILHHTNVCVLGTDVIEALFPFESIGRPLPGRTTIVVTHQNDFDADGVTVVHSIDEILQASTGDEVFIAGGGDLFRQTLSLADRIYLTVIDKEFNGDAFFPEFADSDWTTTFKEEHQPDDQFPYPFAFLNYERKEN